MKPLQLQFGRAGSWFLILLAFSLPISTSAITVTAILVLVCWLGEGEFLHKWKEIITNPICIALFVYLGILVLGLCWADDLSTGLASIRKQWKLWLLPVFLTTVRWERRWWYVAAFIAGVATTMLLIDLAWFDWLRYVGVTAPYQFNLVSNNIVYTPMLALAIYLLLHQSLWGGLKGIRRWLLLPLIGLMIFTLFITMGRAGHVVFFVLMLLLLFQYFHRNMLKAVLLALVLLPLVFTVAYRISPVFQARVDLVQQEIRTFDQNPDTSVGQRLVFWKNSWRIIRQSPWLGVGTGGFVAAYAQMHHQWTPEMTSTDDPHNQYLFSAVQQGVLGLLALLGLFVVQIYRAWQSTDGWERIRMAFPLFFLVIMTTASYLNVYGSGFLFSLFSAVLFKTQSNGQGAIASDPSTRIPG